jgi:hypothetical protein
MARDESLAKAVSAVRNEFVHCTNIDVYLQNLTFCLLFRVEEKVTNIPLTEVTFII